MPELVDRHGVTIVYDRTDPAGAPRGVVQLLHGVGEHAGRYAETVAALAGSGWIVYADDHRGHGRTGMRQHGSADALARLGAGGHAAAVDAVHLVTDVARAEHPDLPRVLVGHSWGSFLAQILFERFPAEYDGVVLIGSALRWPGDLNAGDLNARWKGPDANGVEWISEDPEVQRGFLEDPLTTTTPLAKAFGPWNAAQLFGRPGRGLRERAGRDVPILAMVGRDDPVGGPRSVFRLADAYRRRSGFSGVTTLVFDGRHEILNGFEKEHVRACLAAWLDARWPA
ncbi:alpha/beta fold hydrolase [Microbacterium sp. gxy059]|uniref:alpha/beta fold hydrolase n=1 Tax=Microbacterium sp. gxy059 TaxID=2957199 RepID=UPI003D95C718